MYNLPDVSVLWVRPFPFWFTALSLVLIRGTWYAVNTIYFVK